MGSSKTEKSSLKPPIVDKMAEDKNSIIGALKKAFKWPKKTKKQEKIADKPPKIEEKQKTQPFKITPKVTSVHDLLNKRDKHEDNEFEVFKHHEIPVERNKKITGDAKEKEKTTKEKDDKLEIDELKAFKSLKISERTDRKLNSRLDSQVSDESGFNEKMSDDENTSDTNLTGKDNKEITKTDKTKEVLLEKCDKYEKESGDKRNNQNSQLSNDDKDVVTDMLNKLDINDKEKKVERDPKSNKKMQVLSLSRGPLAKKKDHKIVPYSRPTQPQSEHQEVINPSCLSGGHFTVVRDIIPQTPGDQVSYDGAEDLACTELNVALSSVARSVEDHNKNTFHITFEDVEAFLADEAHSEQGSGKSPENNYECNMPEVQLPETDFMNEILPSYANDYTGTYGELNEYDGLAPAVDLRSQMLHDNMDPLNSGFVGNYFNNYSPQNYLVHGNSEAHFNVTNNIESLIPQATSSSYLTPPYSDNAYSPASDHASMWKQSTSPNTSYYSNFDNLSPLTNCVSPIDKADLETFQNIPDSQEHQLEVNEQCHEIPQAEKNCTKMKKTQYKHMNTKLTEEFSKKECCASESKTSEDILKYCKNQFVEHINKLTEEERRNICSEVARMNLEQACKMLCYILKEAMASNVEKESLNLVLFSLTCERLLQTNPQVFLTHVAVDLLNYAVECNARFLLTRYLVYCVRAANPPQDTEKPIFHWVKAKQNPLHACVARGDAYAPALGELVRRAPAQPPLFDVDQTNSDGFSPLHVCCRAEDAWPQMHTAHVLLKHAAASIKSEDLKGGDTPLHLALNSPHCELLFIITLFNHIDYKDWSKYKGLANRSQKTALQVARSLDRANSEFPKAVLDFLTKISR